MHSRDVSAHTTFVDDPAPGPRDRPPQPASPPLSASVLVYSTRSRPQAPPGLDRPAWNSSLRAASLKEAQRQRVRASVLEGDRDVALADPLVRRSLAARITVPALDRPAAERVYPSLVCGSVEPQQLRPRHPPSADAEYLGRLSSLGPPTIDAFVGSASPSPQTAAGAAATTAGPAPVPLLSIASLRAAVFSSSPSSR
ncbi:hypothetical protein H9P43_005296 [Blastocladiella emersonii ATCC 22665]|nr:hypothetical protein H9P43_005283 [Blastocladiella emersonii ATCC 22665]KAI9179964.1 hypothetical protein H9P43_005296 [Blastocladiella emersonii ATCC 22665]